MAQALVTGATSGIGRAIAVALREAGHTVTALGRNEGALAGLRALGINAMRADMEDRQSLLDALAGQEPEILVNNAGIMPTLTNFCDADASEIERTVAVNLSAVLALTRAVAPGMRERRRGHIVFTGSTAGHAPFANLAVYCATKAAIAGFAGALRLDLAPHGVRVSEIVAGRVETELYRDALSADARAAMYEGGAAVQPQDVAEMVLAVLNLPQRANVARFDILPAFPVPATGSSPKKDS